MHIYINTHTYIYICIYTYFSDTHIYIHMYIHVYFRCKSLRSLALRNALDELLTSDSIELGKKKSTMVFDELLETSFPVERCDFIAGTQALDSEDCRAMATHSRVATSAPAKGTGAEVQLAELARGGAIQLAWVQHLVSE